jgi:NADP-dependent 3-hydroxy acid dehydrogenase YdfG
LSYTDFVAAMELPIGSVFLGTKYVAPLMKKQRSGSIIEVGPEGTNGVRLVLSAD